MTVKHYFAYHIIANEIEKSCLKRGMQPECENTIFLPFAVLMNYGFSIV
jgi:hypothetical protein